MPFCIVWSTGPATVALTMLHPDFVSATAVLAHRDTLVSRGEFPASAFHAILDTASIPQDRYFRPAWKFSAGAVTSALPRARLRHLQKLRRLRKPKLAASDVEMLIANDLADAARIAQLRIYRQSLRDMPINAAATCSVCSSTATIRLVRPAILDFTSP